LLYSCKLNSYSYGTSTESRAKTIMNTSAFLVNLAIAIKDTGFKAAVARVQVKAPSNSEWSDWEAGMAITINDGWEYRMAPPTTTTQHPGGEMPKHMSAEEFRAMHKTADYCYSPFSHRPTRLNLELAFGDNAHKMAFDTAEKAKAAEKIMRGF
jgi:hypothetical protein